MQQAFTRSGAPKPDLYNRVTEHIVADLERGVLPWIKPWSGGQLASRITRPLRWNGTPYGGINVLLLWMSALENGFESNYWMTFRQAAALGAHVRKGERSSLVVYTSTFVPKAQRPGSETPPRTSDDDLAGRRFLKSYAVFSADQIEGLPVRFLARPPPIQDIPERNHVAEGFIKHTGATIIYSGNRAFYSYLHDRVKMPPLEAFNSAEAFYATTIHELAHWAQHPARLSIDFGRKAWGDEGYAMAELFAELTACFVCADLCLTPEPPPDHAAYIASWLKVLKNDKRAIFTAAAIAQKAVDYLYALQPRPLIAAPDEPAALDASPDGP